MQQLCIEFEQGPMTCEHRQSVPEIGRVWCGLHGVWTACGMPICGEIAGCAYDEPDNSQEACARRLQWLRDHKGQGSNNDA